MTLEEDDMPADAPADEQGSATHAVDTEAHLKDLTPRQRKYVQGIVHLMLSSKDAAAYAGLTEHSSYRLRNNALVNRAIAVETKVQFRGLRREVVANLHSVMTGGFNEIARVNAAKALNDIVKPEDTDVQRSVIQPGYVLVIPGLQQMAAPVIEHDDRLPPLPDRHRGYAEATAARWAHKRLLKPRIPRETRGPEDNDEEDQ